MRKTTLPIVCVLILATALAVVGQEGNKQAGEGTQTSTGPIVRYLHPEQYPEAPPESGYVGWPLDVSGDFPPGTSLTLPYSGYDPSYLGLDNLRIYHYASKQWVALDSTVDKAKRKVTASISEPGIYAISAIPEKDTEAPKAAWFSPAEGATVPAKVGFLLDATDNVGVYNVEFYLDEDFIQAQVKRQDTAWFTKLDLSEYASGPHVIKAAVSDYKGNTTEITRRIVLQSGRMAPKITINTPVFDSAAREYKVDGTATCEGTEDLGVGVLVDGQAMPGLAVVKNGRWQYEFAFHLLGPGPHTIKAVVSDEHDNRGEAEIKATLPLKRVVLAYVDGEAALEPVTLMAVAVGGKEVEYCFSITNAKTGAKSILRPYGAGDTYVWKPKSRGSYVLSVSVREKGAQKVVFSDKQKYTVTAGKPAP